MKLDGDSDGIRGCRSHGYQAAYQPETSGVHAKDTIPLSPGPSTEIRDDDNKSCSQGSFDNQ